MPEPYPLPAHAASFWIAGDDLWIAFPGQGPEERGHSIRMPASPAGLHTAIQIMKARSEANDLRLGNKGTPTQYDLEAGKAWGAVQRRWNIEDDARAREILAEKAATAAERAEAREQAKADLKELGL